MGFITKLLDFEEQITFYAAYHHNGINKFIHVIFVPTIMWTVLVWLSQFVFPFLWLKNLPDMFNYSAAFALVIFYACYYILLEPFAGIAFVPVLALLTYTANAFMHSYPKDANIYALYLHIASWIFQFIGHGVFEGRAPALFTSLLQALLLAPLFVWMEVLFVFGYRPKLKKRLDEKASEAIQKWKSLKSSKKSK